MTTASVNVMDPTAGNWDWKPQPEAQKLVDRLLADFIKLCPDAANFAERMANETGTRFKDWVAVILVPDNEAFRAELDATGYTPKTTEFADEDIQYAFENRLGLFPDILLTESPRMSVGIKVESVADFFFATGLEGMEQTQGEPLSRARWAKVFSGDDGAALWVCQRNGYNGFGLTDDLPDSRIAARHFYERFRCRPRDLSGAFSTEDDLFNDLHARVDAAAEEIGVDWACDLFFKAERDYWMLRNTAGRVQYARQERLGLGWANHDHHTYRCTRKNYPKVIETFEKLGFYCRERFYAGGEAGWGAQVLEQPNTGIVIFADVDMSADEVKGDFAHDGFNTNDGEGGEIGTVGLWCALHGESILKAGMHHLEAMFDHHALVEQLEKSHGIKTMDPFTTFPFLRQAFTEGERWTPTEARLKYCLDHNWITPEQADQFRKNGALGSHLENLERNDGFKGFNQTGVSDIIGRTDARKHAQ